MRRIAEIAAGLGLAYLGSLAAARASLPAPEMAAPPSPTAAGDDDAAMPAHAERVADYTLRASLDPVKHTIQGEGTIRWKNASRVPQEELYFHLYLNGFKNDRTTFARFPATDFRGGGAVDDWGWVKIDRLTWAGEDLTARADRHSPGDAEDETDIRVPLPRPVPPGETIELSIAFTSRLPALGYRTGYHGGFTMVGQWFPKLARLEPDGRWAHFRFHRLSEFYADFGTYDVTIDTPDVMVVGATGKLMSEKRERGRAERRFVQEDVHDFAFTAWDQFQELGGKSEDGVDIRVLYPPGHDRVAALELDTVKRGLAHFGAAYGRYPYRTLTVVHPPTGAEEAGGMEYPTLITTGGTWLDDRIPVREIEIVTIHELGHQWFYGLVATDEHAWPFLDEGVNSYAEVEAMEAFHPGSSGFSGFGLSVGISAAHRFAGIEAAAHAPIAQPADAFATGGDYGGLIYSRSALVLGTLANVYGRAEVRRAVGRYARAHRFDHPGPEALIQAVRETIGEDAATQMQRALFERATVDYLVGDLFSEPEDAPQGIFGDPAAPSPAAAAGTGYRGSALVRRRGALRFPVDVDLYGADGTRRRVRWDAAEPSARLPWQGKSRLVRAVIDPEHKVLLDDDLSNNARTRGGGSALSGAVLDRLGFAAAAALGGVLP